MSNPTDTATVTTLATEESNEKQSRVPNFVRKGASFVKNHKKSTIAVGALVGLVGVAALTGKKETATSFTEPSEEAMEEARAALEEMNIPVSQDD
jgi:hypothetical protein